MAEITLGAKQEVRLIGIDPTHQKRERLLHGLVESGVDFSPLIAKPYGDSNAVDKVRRTHRRKQFDSSRWDYVVSNLMYQMGEISDGIRLSGLSEYEFGGGQVILPNPDFDMKAYQEAEKARSKTTPTQFKRLHTKYDPVSETGLRRWFECKGYESHPVEHLGQLSVSFSFREIIRPEDREMPSLAVAAEHLDLSATNYDPIPPRLAIVIA